MPSPEEAGKKGSKGQGAKAGAEFLGSAKAFAGAQNRVRNLKNRAALQLLLDLLERDAAPGLPSYVQVGANDGKMGDPFYPRTSIGRWRALLLEPSPQFFGQLCETYPDNPNVTALNLGVAAQKGQLDLYQLNPEYDHLYPEEVKGVASMVEGQFEAVLRRRYDDVRPEHIQRIAVELDRLDRIIADNDMQDADALIVDVEGFEMQVFDSFSLDSFRPKLSIYERTHLDGKTRKLLNQRHADAGYAVYEVIADNLAIRLDWLTETVDLVLAMLDARRLH